MAKDKVKKERTTLQKLQYWKRWRVGLLATKAAIPFIPFGVILGLNWNSWVGGDPSEGWSIGVGFGMLVVSTVSAVIGIWKKDEIAKSKVSGVFYVALVFIIIGFGLKLLASMINEMGDMLIYVAFGIFGSGAIDQVEKTAIKPKIEFYTGLVKNNGLDRASKKEMLERAQAEREGAQARKDNMDLL